MIRNMQFNFKWGSLTVNDMFTMLQRATGKHIMVLGDVRQMFSQKPDELVVVANGPYAEKLYRLLTENFPLLHDVEPEHPFPSTFTKGGPDGPLQETAD